MIHYFPRAMKMRFILWMIPFVAIPLAGCKKKEEVTTPETPTEVIPSAPVETPAPEVKPAPETAGISVEERAAKLGFAKHLPQDVEALASIHNVTKVSEKLQATKIWELMAAGMAGGMAPDFEDLEIEMEEEDIIVPEEEQDEEITENDTLEAEEPDMGEPLAPMELLGSEVTIAMGKTTGDQFANLLTLNRRMGYFQMRSLAKELAKMAKTGDSSGLLEAYSMNKETALSLLNDEKSGINMLEKLNMPPLYIAMRVEQSKLEAAAQQIAEPLGAMASMGEMVEPLNIERNGSKFTGYKIIGTEVAKLMAAERADMDEMIGSESVDRLIKIVETKNIVVLTGVLSDYVVVFAGASVDDFQPAASVSESLVATDTLAFADAYIGKELVGVFSGSKDMLAKLMDSAGGFADMALGLRDGIVGSDGIGDTRDLETLLQVVVEREEALQKLVSVDASSSIAFLEEGLKIESFGGINTGALDLKTSSKLVSLGDSEDVAIFFNATADTVYDEKARAYYESLMETAYAITMKVAEVPAEEGEMAQFKQMATLFDTQFRTDIISFWDALSNDFAAGLGSESAFILDMKGTMPAVPGVPKPILDNGRIPRIAMISTVDDRAKISAAWVKMNASITSILAKASEMAGTEIPMQKPISSEKDGYTTWFISMPFFNDEFLPSVTVGEKWFAATTSKTHAYEVLDQAAKAEAGPGGMVFRVNFKALQTYGKEMLKMVEDNSAAIFGDDSFQLESFNENKKDMLKALEAMDDLDSLSVKAYLDGSVRRSSVHFKTR